MLPLLVLWSLTHDTTAFIAYAFPVLLCFTWKTSPKEPRPSRFTNSKELGPTWSPAQRSAVLVPADHLNMDPLLKFYHPPPIATVSIPVNGMFIKNSGCRTKFRANLVYQYLSISILRFFRFLVTHLLHSWVAPAHPRKRWATSGFGSGATARDWGACGWILGRGGLTDGHDMMLLKFSQSHWNKSNVYYISLYIIYYNILVHMICITVDCIGHILSVFEIRKNKIESLYVQNRSLLFCNFSVLLSSNHPPTQPSMI